MVARLFSVHPYSSCVCDREGAIYGYGDFARLVRMALHFDQGEEEAPAKVSVAVKQKGVLSKTSTANCRSFHSGPKTQDTALFVLLRDRENCAPYC